MSRGQVDHVCANGRWTTAGGDLAAARTKAARQASGSLWPGWDGVCQPGAHGFKGCQHVIGPNISVLGEARLADSLAARLWLRQLAVWFSGGASSKRTTMYTSEDLKEAVQDNQGGGNLTRHSVSN
jgi:hypothetical protein